MLNGWQILLVEALVILTTASPLLTTRSSGIYAVQTTTTIFATNSSVYILPSEPGRYMRPALGRGSYAAPVVERSITYTVVAGDTGNIIASKFGIAFSALQSLNPGVIWTDLQIGQVLQVSSSGSSSTGESGDARSSTLILCSEGVAGISDSLLVMTSTTTAAAADTTNSASLGTYTVVAGDTGNAIAAHFSIAFARLSAANPGVNWNDLQINQLLQIPVVVTTSLTFSSTTVTRTTGVSSTTTPLTNFATYTVVSGDTGFSIASKLAISFTALSAANPNVNWNNLQIGQTLQVPSTSGSVLTSLTSYIPTGTPQMTETAQVTNQPVYTVNNDDGQAKPTDSYTLYTGDGSAWPPISSWVSFSDMFANAASVIGTNCVGDVAANSADETAEIYDAIQAVAAESLLDHRFILAVILQESNGCVRVPTTYSPAPDFIMNPGLMQSFEGTGTCNSGAGQILDPCPVDMIYQMIEDGAMGTAAGVAAGNGGDGLVQALNRAPGTGAQAFYQAARLYNSGSIPSSGDLDSGATKCYASDIANRLTGWVQAEKKCFLDG